MGTHEDSNVMMQDSFSPASQHTSTAKELSNQLQQQQYSEVQCNIQ